MLVIGISTLGFTVAWILQDRLEVRLVTLIIFVCVGGIATILHDLAHHHCAYRAGCVTEYKFWGLGTVTMLLTAWLFGNAFAKPSRTLIRSEKKLSLEEADYYQTGRTPGEHGGRSPFPVPDSLRRFICYRRVSPAFP